MPEIKPAKLEDPPKCWSPRMVRAVEDRKTNPAPFATYPERRAAARLLPVAPTPPGVRIAPCAVPRLPLPGLEDQVSGTVPAEWLAADGAPAGAPVLVYFHGGGYNGGSLLSHRPITAPLAARGLRVLSVDYRLAPESPFPAALTDAVSAYRHALDLAGGAARVFVGGDSAGGGLAYAAALVLRDGRRGAPMPAGIVAIAPWVDLVGVSPTLSLGAEFDNDWLERGFRSIVYTWHDHDALVRSPLVSPLRAAVDPGRPLPPQMILMGGVDRLLGEGLALALKRCAGGEAVTADLYEDQVHQFQLLGWHAQSAAALDRVAEFVKSLASDPAASPFLRSSSSVISPTGAASSSTFAALAARLGGYIERTKADAARETADYAAGARL